MIYIVKGRQCRHVQWIVCHVQYIVGWEKINALGENNLVVFCSFSVGLEPPELENQV